MAIDISKLQGGAVGATGTAKQNAMGKAQMTPTQNKTTVADDTLSLTSVGSEINALEQRVQDAPTINHEKVQAIKDALSRGDYPFNPERIAAKMLDMERLFG